MAKKIFFVVASTKNVNGEMFFLNIQPFWAVD